MNEVETTASANEFLTSLGGSIQQSAYKADVEVPEDALRCSLCDVVIERSSVRTGFPAYCSGEHRLVVSARKRDAIALSAVEAPYRALMSAWELRAAEPSLNESEGVAIRLCAEELRMLMVSLRPPERPIPVHQSME